MSTNCRLYTTPCTYIYIHTRTYIYIHTFTSICIYAYADTYIYACIYTHIYIYIYVYIYVYLFIFIFLFIFIYVYVCMCVCARLFIWSFSLLMYSFACLFTYYIHFTRTLHCTICHCHRTCVHARSVVISVHTGIGDAEGRHRTRSCWKTVGTSLICGRWPRNPHQQLRRLCQKQ